MCHTWKKKWESLYIVEKDSNGIVLFLLASSNITC